MYVEANQPTDAIATFTKVLAADPANLVAAKSLADIHLARRDNLEALKKFKLYRALSGDRKVDEIIAELEPLVAPKPPPPPRVPPPREALPPPPQFQDTDKGRRKTAPKLTPSAPPPPLADAFEMTSLAFEVGEDSGKAKMDDPFPFVPTRDALLAHAEPESGPLGGPPLAPVAPPPPPAWEPPPPSAWEPSGARAAPPPPPAAWEPPPAAPPVPEAAPPPPASGARARARARAGARAADRAGARRPLLRPGPLRRGAADLRRPRRCGTPSTTS